MSIVYRSIFNDPRPGLVEDGRIYFAAWLESKSVEIDLPSGTGSVADLNHQCTVSVADANDGDLQATRLRLDEERPNERWSTTLTLIVSPDQQWVWIDVEHVSDNAFGTSPLVAPPRIVRDFLSTSEACVGSTPLRAEYRAIDESGVGELMNELLDPSRSIPILVVSKDPFVADAAKVRGRALI